MTAVRSLLEELRRKGEVVELSQDQSTGDRRTTRYALNPETNRVLALYYLNYEIIYRGCTLTGEILHEGTEHKSVYQSTKHPDALIHHCIETRHVVAIGLGVPGIVDDCNYINRRDLNTWESHEISTQIKNTYQLPIVLENDLNAMAAGYAYRLADAENADLVYLHINQGCLCAGLIVAVHLLQGASRFAGEFSDMPFDASRTLLDVLKQDADGAMLPVVIARILHILSCVSNPSLVILGGERLQTRDLPQLLEKIKQCMDQCIPQRMQPKVILRPEFRDDYLLGLMKLSIEQLVPQIINQYGSDEYGNH